MYDQIYTLVIFPLLLLVGQTIIQTLNVITNRKINQRMDENDRKRDEAHAEAQAKRDQEIQWRETVDKLLSEQSAALNSIAQDRIDWYAWREKIIKSQAIEPKWPEDIEARLQKFEQCLNTQKENVDLILRGQISQMRSDIIHRTHRYLDDLGCASTEEKNAYEEEYKEYCLLCETADIKNEFIQSLHDQVMALPGRPDDN